MRGLELKLNQAKLTLNRGKRVPATSCYFLQEDEQMLNRLYAPLGWGIIPGDVMSFIIFGNER